MDRERFYAPLGERPLERLAPDGGFTSVFRTIACVGDSLASGEFVSTDEAGNLEYHDMFEYSWGQYLARMTGAKVYNFSRGGMTASEYCRSFAAENGCWDPGKLAQAYIIALGSNDLANNRQAPGSVRDISREDPEKNADTFAGWYGRIVSRYQAMQPKAKFFFVTFPRDKDLDPALIRTHAALMHDLADFYENAWCIDLAAYGPEYDEKFYRSFYLDNHMNPAGYRLTAVMLASYIDWIIRSDPESFAQVPFIGTPWHNRKARW